MSIRVAPASAGVLTSRVTPWTLGADGRGLVVVDPPVPCPGGCPGVHALLVVRLVSDGAGSVFHAACLACSREAA